MSGMKDKILSGLGFLLLLTFVALLIVGASYGTVRAFQATRHAVKADPPTQSRAFFHTLAPALEPFSKCSAGAGDSTLCRVTIAATAQGGGRDQVIRCTGGTSAAGAAGDPECHVILDFLAKPEEPKSDGKTETSSSTGATTTATPDAGVPDAAATTEKKTETKKQKK